MSALEITPGLWRWTAPHPDWTPQEDWGERVGCALYELPEAAVLFDPVLPREDREGFLRWLDARVSGRPVSVLTTIRWHRRDRSELTERYRTGIGRARGALPEGVVPRWLRGAGEVVFWLPAAQTLIVGDRLLGVPGAGLQLCPESWLKQERARLAAGAVVCSLEADTGDATSAPVLWAPASFV